MTNMDNNTRTCGDCIACCVYLKVSELDKKGFEHCRHLNLDHEVRPNEMQLTGASCTNCKIFNTPERPEVCSGYKCLWLLGHGLEKDRPDRSFIIADTTHDIENGIECKQLKEGIVNTPEAMETIIRMSRSTNKVALIPTFYEVRLEKVVGRVV